MKKLVTLLLSYVSTPLPVGITQFNKWADEIIQITGEFADRDSMTFAIASQVMHLGPQRSRVPKQFFVKSLRKAAANQVASQIFQDIKLKQQEAQKAAQQQAEDTAKLETTTADVQKI